MSETKTFGKGDKVSFKPGPKSKDRVTAEVTGCETGAKGDFLVTVDASGKERRIRPGACSPA